MMWEKAADTNPSVVEEVMPSPERMFQLRDIFMAKIQIKNPIVDAEQLDLHIAHILEHGFGWTSTSCLVLLVLALAAIWGNYPDDFRPQLPRKSSRNDLDALRVPLDIPDERMNESLAYLSMAQKRLFAAQMDDSLVGVVCFCLCGYVLLMVEPLQDARELTKTAECGTSITWSPSRDGRCSGQPLPCGKRTT